MITIIGLGKMPNIKPGDDVASHILQAARLQNVEIQEGDILVVTQKIVSKAEGRIVDLTRVEPSSSAKELSNTTGRDPRYIQVILDETKSVVRLKQSHLIMETHHGFVCANAGVDKSNVDGEVNVVLLPVDPDASARRIREEISKATGKDVAVIISDTFGRPWRTGHVNFAIGIAGLKPVKDYRGQKDMFNYTMAVTMMAVADELASAAELVMNKADGVPVALVKGYDYPRGEGSVSELIRPPEEDLFR